MSEIRLAVAGVGNCASSLLQGIEYYGTRPEKARSLRRPQIGGYTPGDIRVVAAFDIDRRKVGRPLQEAAFALPNCTTVFQERLPDYGVRVEMGPVLDGVPAHMSEYPDDRAFRPADQAPCDVARVLRETGAQVLVNYMPVGSEQATKHYASACLESGVGFVNCMPVFIASEPEWASRFAARRLPIVGDDIKSQVGATIIHRTLARLLRDRGAELEQTYQLNTGGNTDFLNMLERHRLKSKRISKTESVQSQLETPLPPDKIHIGPSDYVPFQNDNKVCFLRMEWKGFGGVPMNLELRLSVEDSPNSAGIVIEAIRCARLALDRGIGGPLQGPSAVYMKRPPVQMRDEDALARLERWIAGEHIADLPRSSPIRTELVSRNGSDSRNGHGSRNGHESSNGHESRNGHESSNGHQSRNGKESHTGDASGTDRAAEHDPRVKVKVGTGERAATGEQQ